MSTVNEINQSKVTIVISRKETLLEALARNIVGYSLLIFCIYLSQGSTFWTALLGFIFILCLGFELLATVTRNSTTFKDKDEAIVYLQKLPRA